MDTSPLLHRRQRGQHPHRGGLARAVGSQQAQRLAGLDLQGQVVDGGEVAVAVGEVSAVDRSVVMAASRCSIRVILSRTSNPAVRVVDFVVVEFVEHVGQRGAAGGARSSAMCWAGSVSRSRPTRRSSGSRRGAATRRPTAWTPGWMRCWRIRPSSAAAWLTEMPGSATDQAQQFGLGFGQAPRRRSRGRPSGAVDGGTGRRCRTGR